MTLNHYRSFIHDIITKKIKKKHRAAIGTSAFKQGRVDKMYMSLCQNNHMNYNTFVKSMHNIYQLMNLSDIETLGCDVLIPLCDVLGKEKANANVRSMKIRSKIRSSNDLKNELLANERMIYSLFTNYTKITTFQFVFN